MLIRPSAGRVDSTALEESRYKFEDIAHYAENDFDERHWDIYFRICSKRKFHLVMSSEDDIIDGRYTIFFPHSMKDKTVTYEQYIMMYWGDVTLLSFKKFTSPLHGMINGNMGYPMTIIDQKWNEKIEFQYDFFVANDILSEIP
jgi:hypothetical protein